jgi:hypothetical protein
MKVDKQLLWLAISSIAVLILGTIGFYGLSPESGFLTAVYQAIQLFSMESGVLDEPPTPLLLELARWLALFTLLAAVFASLQAILTHFKSTIRIAFTKNHAIVCGAGRRGDVIARAFRKTVNGKVVVIEMDENNPSLGELRNLGVEVVTGNALDDAILQKAGIARARTLVAVTGSDEKNLSICTEVETKLNPRCELSAGLESWAWRTYFLDRLKSKIRLDSYLCRASRGLMLKIACDAVRDPSLRSHGVRILIDASDATRQELLRAAILMLQISGDKKPVLEITSVAAGEESAFIDRYPATDLVADLRWHSGTASQTFPEGSNDSPDFAIFSLGSDIETLEAAERFWMRHTTPDDRVIACLQGESDTIHSTALQKKKRDFSVFNLISFGLGANDPLEPDIEHSAKICHAVYFKNEQAKSPSYGTQPGDLPENWARLPERTRESNRLAAMHHEVKRHAWQTKGDSGDHEMLSHLSRCEHMRWMAEKAMDGWRWSGSESKESRDNDKLKHHLLVSYDSLGNPEKDKDYNAFLWSLDITEKELEKFQINDEARRMVKFANQYAAIPNTQGNE